MYYSGNRWYKCDFHLYTNASRCFTDQSMAARDWVERAITQGLLIMLTYQLTPMLNG